ncbi:hypothetical protein TS85_10475 [Sphingomonas hengshuiensis]|uniref:Uncharacterized protein n=1 Tax=Sphingomonas hengshuiensis TaxID=1609977 RepID=A0A7U4LFG3_9SPHN|nr:hypothetical protein TS85_10475 [Sphingomonas hengshuiensis]
MAVKLEGEDAELTGTLRMNEAGVGVVVYNLKGSFVAPTLTLNGEPETQIEGFAFGNLTACGTMNAAGEIHGDWETSLGTGGNFVLFPHSGAELTEAPQLRQLHTARHTFGAISIDRDELIEIAEGIGRDFPSVVITVVAGTEQARYLEDFKDWQPAVDRAEIVRIYARKPDAAGPDQIVSVEFGPEINTAMTQGADEAWVLGRLDVFRRSLKRFERVYVTGFKRLGINFNQVLVLGTIVMLPSLSGLRDRAILMGAVLAIIVAVYALHTRYVPLASIYLRKRKVGLLQRLSGTVASWTIGIIATALAAALAAYLQGYLTTPAPYAEISAPATTPK